MQILVENIYNENLANVLFMILITAAMGIFVYFGTLKNKYDQVNNIKINKNQKISKYCGIIMMLITVIYLGWSYVYSAWQISWIVYPIGAMIRDMIRLLFEEEG